MILTEEHCVKRKRSTEGLFRRTDDFCYRSKNLHNSVNYLISQCLRISRKMKEGKETEPWEQELVTETNHAIAGYNQSRPGKKPLAFIDGTNGNIADAYFLSWYLKGTENYKALPSATCSQICIQEVCRNWKSYFRSLREWKKDPGKFRGIPRRPGYLDKEKGRNPVILTSQRIRVDESGLLHFPLFLDGMRIRARHEGIRQVRIVTEKDRIRIQLMYEREGQAPGSASGVMGIDPGVDNLLALSMDNRAEPVLIDGKMVKSFNRYYNKRKAQLQSAADRSNGKQQTAAMRRLTRKRNRRIRDVMHKASRAVVRLAVENGIGTIVIGSNKGWKQEVPLGKQTNQSFVSIPHRQLADMIHYKAALSGIRVIDVEEKYTSGTSYPDGEPPEKAFYDKSRRIRRGLFRSNGGILINADVNAAYQIMKKAGYGTGSIKGVETVRRIQVS